MVAGAFGRGRSDVLAHEAESILDSPQACPLPPARYKSAAHQEAAV